MKISTTKIFLKSRLIFILFLFGIPRVTLAMPPHQCQSSSENCDFYQCVQQEFPCGSRGYVEKFGAKNCQRYLISEASSSEDLRVFYPKARLCLQNEMQQEFADLGSRMTCSTLKKGAFDSHLFCFVEAGYCELSLFDQQEVLKIAGLSLFSPSSVITGIQILARCQQRFWQD